MTYCDEFLNQYYLELGQLPRCRGESPVRVSSLQILASNSVVPKPLPLLASWMQVQRFLPFCLGLLTHYNDAHHPGKHFTYDYSSAITKGYKYEPAKRRGTHGEVCEGFKHEDSLSSVSYLSTHSYTMI